MKELSNEKISQMLHEESMKEEETSTILRSIYIRYLRLYEEYFSDIDALNDDKIAKLRKYNEETISLVKYYYMDIPQDTGLAIYKFEKDYGSNLLGPGWHKCLFDAFKAFCAKSKNKNKDEASLKKEFTTQSLEIFYNTMERIFRDGFGTSSQMAADIINGVTGLLFGKKS